MAVQIRGCTCFRVRRLARQITRIYDRVLVPTGLRVTQFTLLSMLAWKDGQAMGVLADALDMERTTLTRNLKPLIDAGLVALVRSEADARQREVRLTMEGRARQVDAKRLWRVAQNEVNRAIGEARVASLHRLLDGLIDTLHEHNRSTASSAA
jgi:DNA-binding MarR family transcriptional regulator